MLVTRIRVMREQLSDNGECLPCRQSFRGAGELTAHFDCCFSLGKRAQLCDGCAAHAIAIAEEPHGPAADVFVAMPQRARH